MFLFRILLLPFTLIGMAFALFGVSTRVLLLPLRFVARNPVLSIVLVVGLILYLAIKREPHSLDQLKPAPAQDRQAKAPAGGAPPLVEPVSKIEDGDSAFATDVYATMTDEERRYYSGVFYQTMNSTADGQVNQWSYYNIHGGLRPIRSFQNNSGKRCRTFTEVLKVHRVQQTLSGTACDNGGGTWCKLKPNATPACGLGRDAGAFDGLSRAVKNLF